MPIYEYECQECGIHLEVIQKVSDPPSKKCENDGCSGKLRRLMSNSSFVLKGSRFYFGSIDRTKQISSGENNAKSKTRCHSTSSTQESTKTG